MLTPGRIMGATGVLAGVLTPSAHPDTSWRVALLAGMISGPLAVLAVTGQMPAVEVPVSMPLLLVGGLEVFAFVAALIAGIFIAKGLIALSGARAARVLRRET